MLLVFQSSFSAGSLCRLHCYSLFSKVSVSLCCDVPWTHTSSNWQNWLLSALVVWLPFSSSNWSFLLIFRNIHLWHIHTSTPTRTPTRPHTPTHKQAHLKELNLHCMDLCVLVGISCESTCPWWAGASFLMKLLSYQELWMLNWKAQFLQWKNFFFRWLLLCQAFVWWLSLIREGLTRSFCNVEVLWSMVSKCDLETKLIWLL